MRVGSSPIPNQPKLERERKRAFELSCRFEPAERAVEVRRFSIDPRPYREIRKWFGARLHVCERGAVIHEAKMRGFTLAVAIERLCGELQNERM